MLMTYLPVLVFIALSFGFGLFLVVVGYFFGPSKPDPEKLSAFECGFDAFDDARMKFDVRFYLVAILFILFDLEVAFLLPWAVVMKDLINGGNYAAIFAMILFLGLLVVGFIYEWKKGALEWE